MWILIIFVLVPIAERKQQTQGISSDHELTGVACEGTLLLNPPSETDEVDNTANRIIENMKKELADLKLENSKKDQAILKLLVKSQSMPAAPKNNQPGNSPEFSLDYPQFFRSSDHNLENREVFVTKQDSSKLLISQNQNGNRGLGHTKHKVVRNHSCPAVLISAPVVRRDEETVSPPQMVLCTDARPKARLLQRKHSLGFLPSFRSRNIYFPLPRLSEQWRTFQQISQIFLSQSLPLKCSSYVLQEDQLWIHKDDFDTVNRIYIFAMW